MDDLFDDETGQNSTEKQEVYVYSQAETQGDRVGGYGEMSVGSG